MQHPVDIKTDVFEGFHLLPCVRPEQAMSDYWRYDPDNRFELSI